MALEGALLTRGLPRKIYTDNGTVRVYETGTSQPYSWTSYQIDERDGAALAALDRIYDQTGMFQELADILNRRIPITDSTEDLVAVFGMRAGLSF